MGICRENTRHIWLFIFFSKMVLVNFWNSQVIITAVFKPPGERNFFVKVEQMVRLKTKRVLFIAHLDLFKRTGGGLATLSYYNAVCSLFPGLVDLILPLGCIPPGVSRPDWFGVKPRSKLVAVMELLTGRLHRFKDYVQHFLRRNENRYDLCIINGGVYAGDMIDFIKSQGIKVAVIHHNYEKEYHMDNRTLLTFKGLFPYYVIKNEKKAYLRADLNLFLTNQDVATFRNVYGPCHGRIELLGCFEAENVRLPDVKEAASEPVLVISGSMDTYQTVNGISDFFTKYLPVAKAVEPGLKVVITGRDPSVEVYRMQEIEPEIITIVPNPVDIGSVVSKGSIYCCPTCIGGGLKLRVMDGLRLGMPVLVHALSSRGYDAFFDKPYFKIYSDELSFKRGFYDLVSLISNQQASRSAIQADYGNLFSFSAGERRMKSILRTFMTDVDFS